MSKLTFKHKCEIQVGLKTVTLPIEFDADDVIDWMFQQSDSFKELIIDELMGNEDRAKVARWIKKADDKYIIFAQLRLDRPIKTKESSAKVSSEPEQEDTFTK